MIIIWENTNRACLPWQKIKSERGYDYKYFRIRRGDKGRKGNELLKGKFWHKNKWVWVVVNDYLAWGGGGGRVKKSVTIRKSLNWTLIEIIIYSCLLLFLEMGGYGMDYRMRILRNWGTWSIRTWLFLLYCFGFFKWLIWKLRNGRNFCGCSTGHLCLRHLSSHLKWCISVVLS